MSSRVRSPGHRQIAHTAPRQPARSPQPPAGTFPALALSRQLTASGVRRAALAAATAALLGCASPGQPRPPSLHLPQIATGLSAQRVGNSVRLRWTTPDATTDKLPLSGKVSAVLCRQPAAAPSGDSTPCTEVHRSPVTPGPSAADVPLPPALTVDPIGLLAFRVEILNAAGRSAGRSSPVFAGSGAAPESVANLRAAPVRSGVRLDWTPAASTASIVLDRINAAPPAPVASAVASKGPGANIFRPAQSPAAETHLEAKPAGEPDPGGAIDQSAPRGGSFRYSAGRVRSAVLDGHTVTLESDPSPTVSVDVRGHFPPRPPAGLEAAASASEPTSATTAAGSSIDLSWQPGDELDLAGYNIYRAELPPGPAPTATAWRRINLAPVAIPAFRDTSVHPGTRYTYRVTAVDTDGDESAPGNEVQETPGNG